MVGFLGHDGSSSGVSTVSHKLVMQTIALGLEGWIDLTMFGGRPTYCFLEFSQQDCNS